MILLPEGFVNRYAKIFHNFFLPKNKKTIDKSKYYLYTTVS